MLSQQVKHAMSRPTFSAKVLDLASVLVEQPQNLAGGIRRLLGRLLDSFQEEPQPSQPIALETDGVEAVETETTVVLELSVAKDDVGKVIGKQGRTARAMRTILSAASTKINKRSVLEIIE